MDEFTKSNCALMSDDVRAYMKAFIAARLKMSSAEKSASMSMGKYAKIEDIYNACIVPLGEQGIAVWHGSDFIDGIEILITRLIHGESGQWVQDKRVLYIERANSNQSRGSANTYARKLAVLSLCGLACEDNDCDLPEPKQQVKAHDELLTPEHVKQLTEAINKTKDPVITMSNIKSFNKVADLSQLRASQIEGVIDYIKKCIKG